MQETVREVLFETRQHATQSFSPDLSQQQVRNSYDISFSSLNLQFLVQHLFFFIDPLSFWNLCFFLQTQLDDGAKGGFFSLFSARGMLILFKQIEFFRVFPPKIFICFVLCLNYWFLLPFMKDWISSRRNGMKVSGREHWASGRCFLSLHEVIMLL